jgi:hypothetical protein
VLLPALPLAALLTWWTVDDGGYAATKWLPGTVLAVALLGIIVVTRPRGAPRVPTPARVALAGFAALVAFSYLSIAWAREPGAALQGSHRALLYASITAIGVLLPWTPRAIRVALTVLAGAGAAVVVIALIKLHNATGTGGLFTDARLDFPTGYYNASAALFTLVALPAIALASRRDMPLALRPVMLAIATAAQALALMVESRGWLYTLPVVVLVALVVMPRRVRFLLFLAPVGGAVALMGNRLLEPYHAGAGRDPFEAQAAVTAAAHHVVGPILVASLVVAGIGLVLALADRAVTLSEARERLLRRVSLGVAVLVLIAGIGVGLAVIHDPLHLPHRGWKDFKRQDNTKEAAGKSRFGSLGTSRYDFWRVALDEFKSHPVAGIGQDNFAQQYLLHRRGNEEPRWTHSLELRALTHLGVIGGILMLTALGGLAWALASARRRSAAIGEATALAALPAIVWFVHGSLDWLWEFPVLSGWALGMAGAGASLAAARAAAPATAEAEAVPAARLWARRLAPAAAGVAALALVVAPALDFVAERDVTAAQHEWPTDRMGAFDRLDRAASLTPSSRPKLVEALIALHTGDERHAQRAFTAAHDREPHDWLAQLYLGLIASHDRRTADARAWLDGALRLDPREAIVRRAVQRVQSAHPLTIEQAEAALRRRANRRFGPR